jgi:hypothetical protein
MTVRLDRLPQSARLRQLRTFALDTVNVAIVVPSDRSLIIVLFLCASMVSRGPYRVNQQVGSQPTRLGHW